MKVEDMKTSCPLLKFVGPEFQTNNFMQCG